MCSLTLRVKSAFIEINKNLKADVQYLPLSGNNIIIKQLMKPLIFTLHVRYSTNCCPLLTVQHNPRLTTVCGQTFYFPPVG